MEGHWLVLTDGWAIFAVGCIIYFILSMLVEIGKLVTKKRTPTIKVKGKRCELTDEELMQKLNEDNNNQ